MPSGVAVLRRSADSNTTGRKRARSKRRGYAHRSYEPVIEAFVIRSWPGATRHCQPTGLYIVASGGGLRAPRIR